MLTVIADQKIEIPCSRFIHGEVTQPYMSRLLINVLGRSWVSYKSCFFITAPQNAVTTVSDGRRTLIEIAPNVYEVQFKPDKVGRNIVRLYHQYHRQNTDYFLIGLDGFIYGQPDGVVVLGEAQGHTRIGNVGARWSLIAARDGALFTIVDYLSQERLVQVLNGRLKEVAKGTLLPPPEEW